MKISIIIVTYDSQTEIRLCLESLYTHVKNFEFEIIVVDNNSKDSTKKIVKNNFKSVKVIENESNRGFSVANNQGAKLAKGDFLFFLNPDSVLSENVIEKLLKVYNANLNVGIVAPKIIDENHDFVESTGDYPNFFSLTYELFGMYLFLPLSLFGYRHTNIIEDKNIYGWVSGACFLIKKDFFTSLDGFDENFFLYYEDTDLCLRTKNILKKNILITNEVNVMHMGGKSSIDDSYLSKKSSYRSKLYYSRKHIGFFSYLILIPLSYLAIIIKLIALIISRKSKEQIFSQFKVFFNLL